ncbi:MAG: site-2 protease family protein, partial [Candidatus Omnitrophica bacterium]|nr:site-2 protease family protein [Candidatus Omnitrophota bacterium]
MGTKSVFFKAICVMLAIAFLANDISFAAEEVRSRLLVGQGCLAAPLRSAPIVGVTSIDGSPTVVDDPSASSLISKSPVVFFFETIATSLLHNLTAAQARDLINTTVIQQFPDDRNIQAFDIGGLRLESRDNTKVFILPFVRGGALVFTREPYDYGVHVLKFDLPEGTVTVRPEGLTLSPQVKANNEPQQPVVERPKEIPSQEAIAEAPQAEEPQVKQPQGGDSKSDHAKFEGIGERLKRLLGYNRSVLIGSIALSLLCSIAYFNPSLAASGAILLTALAVHEYAHVWMAARFGDDTAKDMGRLTLNPFAHSSFIGTIVMPILTGFGWA